MVLMGKDATILADTAMATIFVVTLTAHVWQVAMQDLSESYVLHVSKLRLLSSLGVFFTTINYIV